MDVFLSIAFLVICGAVGALIGGLPVYLFFRLLSRELKKRGLLLFRFRQFIKPLARLSVSALSFTGNAQIRFSFAIVLSLPGFEQR